MDDRQQDAPVRPAVKAWAWLASDTVVSETSSGFGDEWPVTAIDGPPAEVARRVRDAVVTGYSDHVFGTAPKSDDPEENLRLFLAHITARVLAALGIKPEEVRDA